MTQTWCKSHPNRAYLKQASVIGFVTVEEACGAERGYHCRSQRLSIHLVALRSNASSS